MRTSRDTTSGTDWRKLAFILISPFFRPLKSIQSTVPYGETSFNFSDYRDANRSSSFSLGTSFSVLWPTLHSNLPTKKEL